MNQSCYKEIITAKLCQIIHALSSLDPTWFLEKKSNSIFQKKKQIQMNRVRERLDGLIVKRYVLDLKFFVQKLLFYYLGLSLILNNGARERMQSCVKHYQARDGENQ